MPARLDRLPWSRWHVRVVTALGVTWVLDGLEVTIVGAVAAVLTEPDTLHLDAGHVGAAASAYLAGAIVGALLFGWLTDRWGRKRLFLITLALYLGATLCTALAWSFASFAAFRALTGAGIGGEGSAINSAIDELLPARVRGRADVVLNGTYWLGTVLGSLASLVLLDARLIPHRIGWRLPFGLGAVLGLAILLVRRHLPESPRWLVRHGRAAEAEAIVLHIERQVARATGEPLPAAGPCVEVETTGAVGLRRVISVLVRRHPRRTALGLVLMIAQAFAYNAVFFTYALVLGRWYGVPAGSVGRYLVPFAIGNWLGPLTLGRLFDTLGRRPMIAWTYGAAAALLALAAVLFGRGALTALTQTALWTAVFFVASAAASAAYLTVSELFPVEMRGLSIALFYAVGTAIGGLAAPALFGAAIASGRRGAVADYRHGGGPGVARRL